MKIIRCFDIIIDEKAIYFVREEVNFLVEGFLATIIIVRKIIEEISVEELSMRAENIDVEFSVSKRYKILY